MLNLRKTFFRFVPCRERLPEITASLVLYFPSTISFEKICASLNLPRNAASFREGENVWEVKYTKTAAINTWEVGDALVVLFSLCDVESISNILKRSGGTAFIDIVCYHHEKYPAFVFEGEVMKKIRYLEADFSIDLY